MKRSIYTLGGLLILALILSYISWTRESPAPATGDIRVLNISPDTLESLKWTDETGTVNISSQKDDHGKWLLVKVERTGEERRKPPISPFSAHEAYASDSSGENDNADETDSPEMQQTSTGPKELTEDESPDEAVRAEEKETEPETDTASAKETSMPVETRPESIPPEIFTGGAQAERVMDAVAPLMASRRLDGVSGDRLKAMGLEGTKNRLEITTRNQNHVLEIGNSTYGGGHIYMRFPGKNTVYLINSVPFRPIEQGAARLMKRELLNFQRSEIISITVQSVDGRQTKMLHQSTAPGQERSFFADSSEPERRVEQYNIWAGKVLALRSIRYVQQYDLISEPEPVLILTFKVDKSKSPVNLEVFRKNDHSGEEKWYARTEHTRSLVELQNAAISEIMADINAILDN